MVRDLTITPILVNHHPLPGKTSWVKVFIYEPTEEKIVQTRGKMYALLSVSSRLEVDFSPVMQLILEELQANYFQQTTGGILVTLEQALDGIHKKLLLMGQQDKRLSVGFDFNLLTAISWGTVLYVGRLGALHAALYRQQKLQYIDDLEDTGLYLASGVIQAQDRIIMATAELFDQADKEKLKHCLDAESDQIAKQLESILTPGELNAKQSAIVLDIDIKEIPSPEEESLHIQDSAVRQSFKSGMRWFRRLWDLGAASFSAAKKAGRHAPPIPVILAAIATLALGASIFWNITHHSSGSHQTADLQPMLQQINTEFSQAKSLADINPDRAQDLLATTQKDINAALSAQPQNSHLIDLKNQAQALADTLLKVRSLDHIAPIATLSSSVVSQSKLTFYNGTVYFVDGKKHQLIDIDSKGRSAVLATNQSAFTSQSRLLKTDNGLVSIAGQTIWLVNNNSETPQPTSTDNNLTNLPVASYQQNVYVFDNQLGQVYRYTGTNSGFGPSSPYLKQALSNRDINDIAVDGSVYLLYQNGTVEQYVSGNKQSFSLERASLAQNPRAVITNENTDNLYILANNSILVWNKAGQYQGQYRLSDGSPINGFAVDEVNQTVYILSSHQLLKATLPALE